MAYQQGDTITAADYNTFANNVNAVIGTGSGAKGYGLSEITTLSAGATITAAQWNSLLSGLQKAANHQGTTLTNASNTVTTGGNILPLSNLAADITLIDTNADNADASNMSTGQAGITSQRTDSWSGTITHTFTVNFGSQNAARHFFNSGGKIHMAFTRTGGSSTDQNTAWTDLFSGLGTVSMDADDTNKSGGSYGTNTNIGYRDLTTSNQTIMSAPIGSGDYSANDVLIQAKTDGSGLLTFQIDLNDDHPAGTGTFTGGGLGTAPNEGTGWTGADSVDGTVTSTVTFDKADNASFVQVASPSFANTATL
tara:strand:- start:10015 stop:10944 length:930 start_codon:yes stop_codon:yes gene_type:complete